MIYRHQHASVLQAHTHGLDLPDGAAMDTITPVNVLADAERAYIEIASGQGIAGEILVGEAVNRPGTLTPYRRPMLTPS